ncbi:acetylornithine deacetylase [Bradyrhizobium prioriisuperbiae]|uniref:acetylornithine deacetylase n=1 Tax=Bradyrhizobium prioriisuperbiae TaxID=2854389 RepID=UPI0028EE05BE|nr:acetylornithine deacetylase [Bradyrhizobium prioritasuperba]
MSHSPDSLSILRDLVSFPTVSSESNIALISYVEEYLADYGIRAKTILSEDGRKANLYATIGPDHKPGVLLSGHTDVVPTHGQDWLDDPFVMRVMDGKAIGRGTVDMKGFVACVLNLASNIETQRLQRPIHMAFSHDEEIGCVGVRRMLPEIARLPCAPTICVIGEPTGMSLVTAHKGKLLGRVRCQGVPGHSSDPDDGANAIMMAGELLQEFAKLQNDLRRSKHIDEGFAVPFSTVHVGRIDGGTILNVIPPSCCFDFEIRNLPGDDPVRILQQLSKAANAIVARYQATQPLAAIDIEISNSYPALRASSGGEQSLLNGLARESGPSKVSFGTEAGLYAEMLGVPAVVCGPGSVQQAHRSEEYIELSQLAACDTFLRDLMLKLTNPAWHPIYS